MQTATSVSCRRPSASSPVPPFPTPTFTLANTPAFVPAAGAAVGRPLRRRAAAVRGRGAAAAAARPAVAAPLRMASDAGKQARQSAEEVGDAARDGAQAAKASDPR